MKVLEKVRGKRSQSLIHIWDECNSGYLIGLCQIWINDDNWEIRERDDNNFNGICSRCLAKLEKIRNPPPPSPPKKPRLSKEQTEKNRKEKKQKAAEQELREWNELCLEKGKGKGEKKATWRRHEF